MGPTVDEHDARTQSDSLSRPPQDPDAMDLLDEDGDDQDNDDENVDAEDEHAKYQVEHVLFPAFRRHVLLPTTFSNEITLLTSMQELYKVFERC